MEEAKKRLEKYGKNTFEAKKKKSFIGRIISQLSDKMIIILLISALVSFALSYFSGEKDYDWVTILVIVGVNSFIGAAQESKAENAMNALKKLTAPHAMALRNGEKTVVKAEDIVPGDIVFIEKGDVAPADIRLIKGEFIKVDESSLTGESIEADKKEFKEALSETLKKDEFDGAIFAQTDELRNALAMETEKSESALGGLKSLVEDLSKKSDSLAQAERIDDLMKSLNAKIDVLATSGEADKVQEMLSALHEKVDIIAMSEDESKFVDLEEIIQALHEKVDIIAMSDESSHIEDLVQALHDKVDVIAATDDAELYNEIQDIKDLIDEQRKQIEAFGSEDSDLDKRLQTLQTEISNIDFAKSASDIKDTVMNAMLAVTDQITFAQETEEIKGFVEERTEEINKNLLDVKKQLCSMASGSDVWDYSYTMQDIESDIAKLRLILNDISASTSKEDLNDISKNMHKLAASVNNLHSTLTEEQIHELRDNVSKINEDVVSLSTRTNKLLLNSDESHRALTDGLDELNKVLAMFGSTASGEALQDKLDRINAAIANSANTDNIMKEVMLYLGEWIDDAGEKINTIASDTANLSSINSELCYLKTMMGNSDIIESIRQKFEVQQNRIDVLETKLDRVLALLDTGKIESLEDKVDDLSVRLFEKMRGLDTKLNKLTDGIEKLASYVDEE